jgi:hypothetical protein
MIVPSVLSLVNGELCPRAESVVRMLLSARCSRWVIELDPTYSYTDGFFGQDTVHLLDQIPPDAVLLHWVRLARPRTWRRKQDADSGT